jgi:hypothetical protein
MQRKKRYDARGFMSVDRIQELERQVKKLKKALEDLMEDFDNPDRVAFIEAEKVLEEVNAR